MGMFSNLARKSTTLSPLIEGKSKVSVEDIIAKHGGIVTITAFDVVNSSDNDWYPVLLIAEEPDAFMFGGFVLKKIVGEWLTAFDGDVEACSKALGVEGGCKVKLEQARTKTKGDNGIPRNITRITVL